jgi:hypothetical protein
MLYIHETTANFTAMMNDWRRHPHTKYNNEYKAFDSKFCLRPSWPFPKDYGQYLEWKKSDNYTMKMNSYYLLEEEELIACGNSRSVFLWRGGKSHAFDGIESFKLLNRDFSEVKRFSVKFCELLPRGHTMTVEAIKKTPLPSDTYWGEEAAAA